MRLTDPDELAYLRQEQLAANRYQRYHAAALARHPNCRDPDHPGCPRCEPDDFDQDQ